MTRAVSRPNAARPSPARSKSGRYLRLSESPLHSLALLLPLLILFEVGTYLHRSDPIAYHRLQECFALLGASVRFLPALAMVLILLCWHVARKDSWNLDLGVLVGMLVESILLALPLLLLAIAMSRWRPHLPLQAAVQPIHDEIVLSLGAGLYEELVFRLILITGLTLLLQDLLKIPKNRSVLLIVASSAILFSLYHYLGNETFQLHSFVFRTVAGVYFSVLFLTRGFGITSSCHAFYDIMIVVLLRSLG